MDLLPARFVQVNFDAYQEMFPNGGWMMTNLLIGENADKLVAEIVARLPEGPKLFPDEMFTDQPLRSLTSEIIREKALHHLREEVPHSVAVAIETWEVEDEITAIGAVLIVETDGQKKIVIGRKGSMLGRIGSEARQELIELIGGRVHLDLFVKVDPGWRESPGRLQELDYLE
jgi:GTP-binding protein Era